VLAAQLGIDPKAVRFRAAPPGTRPRLDHDPGTVINFSLSHTFGLAVVAVIRDGRQVGVDIESTARRVRVLPLARHYLSPTEADELAELGGEQRTRRFLLMWTRYEAAAKLTGQGLPAILEHTRAGRVPVDDGKIEFHHFAPTSRHIGTLALETKTD
jgi:4'-phosphopantetheinyl transferase